MHSTDKKSFDHIVVGGSLLAMSFAVVAAKRGETVCIVEKQSRLGGAWAVGDALGLKDIETSPHIFLPDKAAYAFLDKHLNSQFERIDIPPRLSFRPHSQFLKKQDCEISDMKRYAQLIALGEMETTSLFRPMQFYRRLKRLRKAYKTNEKEGRDYVPVMYPKGGLAALFSRAEQSLRRSGVDICMNANIVAADVLEGQCKITLEKSGVIFGRKLWLNRHVELNDIRSPERRLELQKKVRTSSHFVFQTRNVSALGFRQFAAPFPVLFVNDVTEYIPDRSRLPHTDRLFCARTVSGLEVSAEGVFEMLKAEGYFSAETELAAHSCEVRQVVKTKPASIAKTKTQLGPHVDFLLADDLSLMRSISALSDGT